MVDDERRSCAPCGSTLWPARTSVDVDADDSARLKTAASARPDLIVLDLGLPDIDGLEVIRGLRGWTRVPIIVLSGRAGSGDKVAARMQGPTTTSPSRSAWTSCLPAFAQSHAARPAPASRRRPHRTARRRRRGPGRLGRRRPAHPTEWRLLEILVRKPGKLVGQRQLLHDVWGQRYQTETHYLRQYMAQLRHKLEEDPAHPRHLLTEPGMGYRLRPRGTRVSRARRYPATRVGIASSVNLPDLIRSVRVFVLSDDPQWITDNRRRAGTDPGA